MLQGWLMIFGVQFGLKLSEIWKYRNNVIFKKGKVDVFEVFVLVQVNVSSWIYSKS